MLSPPAEAAQVIEDFDLDEDRFHQGERDELEALGLHTSELGDCRILLNGKPGELTLKISNRGTGNRVFIGSGVHGRLSLGFAGNNSTLYIGRDVSFADQHIGSRQDGDFIAIGNDVAVTGPGRWVSGLRCGSAYPFLIVGDACVLARDVVIRNSDGHPVMNPTLSKQLNSPRSGVLLEPHCWLGERCAVLKDVTVGAFAVIGFGAVVTRDVPRHHIAQGNPAQSTANSRGPWCWDDSAEGTARAKHYLARYPLPSDF